ncbi:MAG: CBS domain-containing protein, partial [Candidatus Omnitrophica bacterium]|nr:CBS domain-containing protein [Candidatus Omnitrophota bacterium]
MDSRKSKLDASFLVKEDLSVKDAMRQIGEAGDRILFVINDDQKLLGSLTDGDIRRWVLSEGTLASDIRKVFNKDPICVKADYSTENVKNLMLKKKIPGIPVVDDKGIVKDVLIWSSVFGKNGALEQEVLDFPVVIMAGGKGSRLDPFTRILPKPLIPIGEKTILEIIMDRYSEYQVKEFYLSINHKSQMIKAYFEEASSPYKISYIEEDKPLGTAGSLK